MLKDCHCEIRTKQHSIRTDAILESSSRRVVGRSLEVPTLSNNVSKRPVGRSTMPRLGILDDPCGWVRRWDMEVFSPYLHVIDGVRSSGAT